MKRINLMALLLCVLLLPWGAALAQGLELDGVIEPAATLTLSAPYSGMVQDFTVRAGDAAAAGEALFTISAKEIYADTDGVVCGLFALPGDSAAVVQERYGALCYIERDVLYTASCSTSGAAGDNANKIIHPGETVYVESTANDDRRGSGRVTTISGGSYTVELLEQTDIRLNESIEVFRGSDCRSADRIGSGRVSRVDPVPVTAEGYVLGVHVEEGQRVSRGDLLFTIVPDALDGMKGGSGAVSLPEDGVVLSVLCASGDQTAKDAPLATYCPAGRMELVLGADEDDLLMISEGMIVTVMPDALKGLELTGTVRSIARAANDDGEYTVIVALPENADVRIGMSATAVF